MHCKGNFLIHPVALLQCHRERELQRRAVSLEGGISPVALILHLENITLEIKLSFDMVGKFPPQFPDIETGLIRSDHPGEVLPGYGSIRMNNIQGTAPALLNGVENAKPDAVSLETAPSTSAENIFKPVTFTPDRDLSIEYNIWCPVTHAEIYVESVLMFPDGLFQYLEGQGLPVVITYRTIDGTDHLGLIRKDPPDLAFVVKQCQIAGTQRSITMK
jgi:hypothetical protein